MRNTEIGIIGGGQLGMMLLQTAIPFPVHVSIYDPDPICAASYFSSRFQKGDFSHEDDIVQFGETCDIILFETEKTNVQALKKLESMGKKVLSSTHSLEWIQDKGVQRNHLKKAGFPVPEFQLISREDISAYSGPFPVVQKARSGGYDGQGVKMIKDQKGLENALAADSVFEEKIEIEKELSVIVARTSAGEIAVYPPVEMVFEAEENIVDYIISPAPITPNLSKKVESICKEMAHQLNFIGVYAIELFIDTNNDIIINEISPRPHNSGHHTISSFTTSQYEQQIRISLDLPLGEINMLSPCILLNLLGAHATGATRYKGIHDAYKIPHVQYVFYGKSQVKPFRKMGHAVIMESDLETAFVRLKQVKETLTITSYES